MRKSPDAYITISQSLPILRGWAIVWIVAYHLMGNTKGYLVLNETLFALSEGGIKNIVDAALALFISAGNTGVNIFLVNSGFGLTASWWKRYGSQGIDTIPLGDFWRRRVFKIFPLFWVAVTLSILLYFLNSDWAPFGQEIWDQGILSVLGALFTTLSTLRNFIPDYYYFLNGAWWYVGLSLQLYIVFPLLIKLGSRWGWLKLLTYSLLFSLAYRAVFSLIPIGSAWTVVSFAFFPARLFDFTFGIYLAQSFLSQAGSHSRSSHHWLQNLLFKPQFLAVNFSCFLLGLIFRWLDHPILNIFPEPMITLGLFCGLVCLSQHQPQRLSHLAQTVGRYSYGIYLTHMNIYLILWPIATALVPSYWPRLVAVTIACCVIGAGFELSYIWMQGRSLKPRRLS